MTDLKQWRPWTEADCPECGNDTIVFTDSGKDRIAFDGDAVRCDTLGCPARGTVSIGDAVDEGECEAHTIWSYP